MKLRNKKTGEIVDWMAQVGCDESCVVFNKELIIKTETTTYFYQDLFGFMRDWECEDNQPLIKDESMREAIRAWAKCCGWESFIVCNDHFNNCYLVGYKDNKSSRLEFNNTVAGASKKRRYTIAELCGEEEE